MSEGAGRIKPYMVAPTGITERYAQCQNCFATELLDFRGSSLVATTKFAQRDGTIYHCCTSGFLAPCQLYNIISSKV